ncbi:peroxidase-like [Mercenaria mercenaria]|uniref:peroxidase-like n=1 Tax=Mercenaria mercenaria TaxID=6596 RepID=UPI00234EF230|nr:peroxidase-like [Mercenaria mercenaria]XP_053373327.1 peroxidase-like [Mercenaria mercenaria]XP_053373328.1 peroxidase-like [Mercenaria mercenaria]
MVVRCFHVVQRCICIILILCLVFLQGTDSSDKVKRKRRAVPLDKECEQSELTCQPDEQFRTMDGSCNNLANPRWGMSNRLQNRLLKNVYDDDKGAPRAEGCNSKLPLVRQVSNIIHAAGETSDLDYIRSQFIMTFGQFLAHDTNLTPMVEKDSGGDLECCGEDSDNTECHNIVIPEDDTRFKPGECMPFSRSVGRLDCNDVRQQVNMQTSYIDLSMSYGKNMEESSNLRNKSGGMLNAVNPGDYLPVDESPKKCELRVPANPPSIYCPKSGDPRATETPVLASLHTIIHREHNRLAEALAGVNPSWSDEQLFQTARKINIGQWQHIVYNEYLPATIGSEKMEEYGIDVKPSGHHDTYNESMDATVFNAFSTAAFRFGHSLIPQALSMVDFDFSPKRKAEELKNHFFKADLYHTYNKLGIEYLLMGMANSPCPRFDRKFENSVRQDLFFDEKKVGEMNAFDLPALNNQRGRDHGLPGYNEYREYCGLPKATSFSELVDHLPDVAALLENAYDCTDDIDLFVGLVTEKPSKGSQVGPVTQCLLAQQFKNLKDGDRFFYERQGTGGFTPDQLEEIKKIRMSTLFCLNTDAKKIQGNMFLRIKRADGKKGSCYKDYFSELEDCDNMTGVNIYHWIDMQQP